MARPIEHAGDDGAGLDALRLGDGADILGRGFGEVDRPFGIARPDGKLVHIDVGRIEEAALLGDGEDGERVGPRSEEHTSELQSLMRISYAVFCLKKTINNIQDKDKQYDGQQQTT